MSTLLGAVHTWRSPIPFFHQVAAEYHSALLLGQAQKMKEQGFVSCAHKSLFFLSSHLPGCSKCGMQQSSRFHQTPKSGDFGVQRLRRPRMARALRVEPGPGSRRSWLPAIPACAGWVIIRAFFWRQTCQPHSSNVFPTFQKPAGRKWSKPSWPPSPAWRKSPCSTTVPTRTTTAAWSPLPGRPRWSKKRPSRPSGRRPG